MTFLRLLLRNLIYHRRGNLAVLLGVALGTAVLTGALLVGNSLRGSLRELTLDQLSWVEDAMLPGRFFRAALADELPAEKVSPAILLQSSIERGEAGKETARVNRVTVLGVNASFWPNDVVPVGTDFWQSDAAEVVLNDALARALGAVAGDTVTLRLQKADAVPRESLLGKRRTEDVVEAIRAKVRAVLLDDGMARFTLKPTPEPARNAFVPLGFLQSRLDQPLRANALLGRDPGTPWLAALKERLTLDDWGLRLRSPKDRATALVRFLDPRNEDGNLKRARWRGKVPEPLARVAEAEGGVLRADQVVAYYERQHPYWSLESRQLLLDPSVVASVLQGVELPWRFLTDGPPPGMPLPGPVVGQPRGIPAAGLGDVGPIPAPSLAYKVHGTLVYLADTLSDGMKEVPYAVIAGVDRVQFEPEDETVIDRTLRGDQIDLVEWPGSPLRLKPGDPLLVTYYAPDEHNHLEKRQVTFTVRKLLPMERDADDPDLTPEFPGITDKLSMAGWENPPFPYNPRRVKPADEEYWQRYRATPRAYVSLAKAQELWGSRFGKLTSLQIYPSRPAADETTTELARQLLRGLHPAEGGFVFQPVREQAERASHGSADFGVLFLSFSFFLIVSALLLVGLLVRLNIDRRAGEVGLLLATGWSHRRVRRLMLAEGLVLAVVGGAVGLLLALAFAPLMLNLLRANWPGASDLAFLRLHAEPRSFAIGYVASLVVSVLTIIWATRVLGRLEPRSLLAGVTSATEQAASPGRAWSWWVMIGGALGAVACGVAGAFAEGHEAKAGSFFGCGALLLTALVAAVWRGLRSSGRGRAPQPSLTRLGMRNAGRHAVRSVLTVGLLAAATFLIVAVESFHKEAGADFATKGGGSGGFPLLAESDVPIFQDLNQPAVRDELGLTNAALADVRFYSCRVQGGDDASCLNLYQPLTPKVLGLPADLLKEPRFHFSAGLWETEDEKTNPWLLLQRQSDDGTVPAVLDANTAQWILKKGLGEVIETKDGNGDRVRLRVVALLQESIFQSEVLVAGSQFLKLYPRQEGFSFFLIDAPPEKAADVKAAVESALGAQGVSVTPSIQRLQAYLAVENTYLATFQALGGLGLLLGAAGLAIVLLRGVWERRGELALLQALGFRPASLAWLVLAENALLLVLGLAAGTVAALAAVAPHLAGAGAATLGLRVAALLGLVVLVGLVAGLAAVLGTVRTPVLTALRRE